MKNGGFWGLPRIENPKSDRAPVLPRPPPARPLSWSQRAAHTRTRQTARPAAPPPDTPLHLTFTHRARRPREPPAPAGRPLLHPERGAPVPPRGGGGGEEGEDGDRQEGGGGGAHGQRQGCGLRRGRGGGGSALGRQHQANKRGSGRESDWRLSLSRRLHGAFGRRPRFSAARPAARCPPPLSPLKSTPCTSPRSSREVAPAGALGLPARRAANGGGPQ